MARLKSQEPVYQLSNHILSYKVIQHIKMYENINKV